MTEMERNKLDAGAPDIHKQKDEIEQQIRKEVEKDLGHLTPAAREAVVQSKLKLKIGSESSKLIRVDLGENAGKKVKNSLFE